MKFSRHWLQEWVKPLPPTDKLVDQLTMAGLEVESIEPVAASFNKVVIGRLLTIEPYSTPKENNTVKVCQVAVGQQNPITIVSHAPNLVIGVQVPVALVGAQLPTMIVESHEGVLCTSKMLGLSSEETDDVMLLPQDSLVGTDIREYLGLEDESVELGLTPNRGDCLSIVGIAREVALFTGGSVKAVDYKPVEASTEDKLPVDIEAPEACPRYIGRIIKGINVKAKTPLWMQERLRRSGMRSINAVVDVTNYVLLELGQPMHAFDLQKLEGGIRVRMAQATESLTLLNEQTINLANNTLVIADHKKPHALAGVMGGLASSVTDDTDDLFLESAFFSPSQLAGCARHYGLHTDSSHRFERGVDYQLQRIAIERATQLLLEIVGGKPGVVVEQLQESALPVTPVITLRKARINTLLSIELPDQQITTILSRLGAKNQPLSYLELSTSSNTAWQVKPPSFRFDLTQEIDLIEEIARVYGYNQLPSRIPRLSLTLNPQRPVGIEQLQAVLTQRNYQEVITYSFVDVDLQKKLTPNLSAIELSNPIAKRLSDNPTAVDMSVMRTTLWTGLIQTLLYNQKRQQAQIRLFETGLRFIPTEKAQLNQENMLAGLATGTRYHEQWGEAKQLLDFFDVKSDVEALLNLSDNRDSYQFKPTVHPALHPGQTAAIYREQEWIGILGKLHPSLMHSLEISQPTFLFELRIAALCQPKQLYYKEVSKYPSIRRDIALIVEQQITIANMMDCIRQTAPHWLVDIQLFDVYQGEKIEPGKKSIAIGLIFQEFSRNLRDSEVDTVIGQVLSALENSFKAQQRK